MKKWNEAVGCSELGFYVLRELGPDKPSCQTATEAAKYYRANIQPGLLNPDVETMHVLLLNVRRAVIGHLMISTGTLETLLVHPREIFRGAILAAAHGIVLMHNHPSGDPTPSEADIKVTRDLIRGGQILKIDVLDHLVMGQPGPENDGLGRYNSLRELGYFYQS